VSFLEIKVKNRTLRTTESAAPAKRIKQLKRKASCCGDAFPSCLRTGPSYLWASAIACGSEVGTSRRLFFVAAESRDPLKPPRDRIQNCVDRPPGRKGAGAPIPHAGVSGCKMCRCRERTTKNQTIKVKTPTRKGDVLGTQRRSPSRLPSFLRASRVNEQRPYEVSRRSHALNIIFRRQRVLK
jgi:hypothetical protein